MHKLMVKLPEIILNVSDSNQIGFLIMSGNQTCASLQLYLLIIFQISVQGCYIACK